MTAAGPTPGRMVVVVPTYDEAENIGSVVARTLAAVPDTDVLVVDDASPDGTGRIADELAAADPRVRVVHRTAKAGLGAAYLHGFAVALADGYDLVGEMDADGSHQPEQLPLLLAALDGAGDGTDGGGTEGGAGGGVGLVIGSRWVPGGSVVNWSAFRKALSVGGNLYARVLLGIPVRDVTAGFRVFRASTLRAIDLDSVTSVGYCFQADLTLRTVRAGLRVREVPIEFVERVHGQSKMTPEVALESLRRITRWGLELRRTALVDGLRGLKGLHVQPGRAGETGRMGRVR